MSHARLFEILVYLFVKCMCFDKISKTVGTLFYDLCIFMFLGISSNVLSSFSRGFRALGQLLCVGTWVLSDLMIWESTFVHRGVGFKRFYD